MRRRPLRRKLLSEELPTEHRTSRAECVHRVGIRSGGVRDCAPKSANRLQTRPGNGRHPQTHGPRMLLILSKTTMHPGPSIELITQRSKVQILPPQPTFSTSSKAPVDLTAAIAR